MTDRTRIKMALVRYASNANALGKIPAGLLDEIASKEATSAAAVSRLGLYLTPAKAPRVRAPRKPRPRKPTFGGKRALIAAGECFVADLDADQVEGFDGQSEALDIAMCVTGLPLIEAEIWADWVYDGMLRAIDKRRNA